MSIYFQNKFFFIYNLTDKNTLYPNSREEIVSIQDAANRSGLEIIPLVQTYGHLEVTMKPILSLTECKNYLSIWIMHIQTLYYFKMFSISLSWSTRCLEICGRWTTVWAPWTHTVMQELVWCKRCSNKSWSSTLKVPACTSGPMRYSPSLRQ